MKFSLTGWDKGMFQKEFPHLETESKRWYKFWLYIDNTDFSSSENIPILADEYFTKIEPKRIIHLSDKEFIKQLGDIYAEHRSDITDIIVAHEADKLPLNWKTWREHRFTTFMIPLKLTNNLDHPLECQYDTLTGHLEIHINSLDKDDWIPLDGVKYED